MTAQRNAFRPGIEALEDRSLMSISSAFLSGSQLIINGTNGNTWAHSYRSGGNILVEDQAPSMG